MIRAEALGEITFFRMARRLMGWPAYWTGAYLVDGLLVDCGPPATARQDINSSRDLHVVERFTRTDASSILYQFTVDDPSTWTKPWSGEIVMRKWEGPIFEYACHEGNYGLGFILSAARVQEKQAAQ